MQSVKIREYGHHVQEVECLNGWNEIVAPVDELQVKDFNKGRVY